MLQLFLIEDTGFFFKVIRKNFSFKSKPPAFRGLDMGLSEQGMGKGGWVVKGRLCFGLGELWLV